MVYTTRAICLAILVSMAMPAWSDFKYSETSQITGGAMAGVAKFVGAFSKQARQATQPTETTTYLKGNLLRKDEPEGQIQIIDLDGRRIIHIDGQKQTYSVITFDQMKAAIERAREQAKSQQPSQPAGEPPPNVQITPKVEVSPTGKSATILNLATNEVQMSVDMMMQSTDPRSKGQSGSMWVKSDAWITPNVPGYEQLSAFYKKLGNEMDWVPGTLFGGNPQMSQGMAELQKNASALKGFPLLDYVSMGMAANGQSPAQGTQTATQQSPPPQQQASTDITNPGAALAKGIGGMFGGFGHKKKKEEPAAQENSTGAQASSLPAAPPPTQGSLMDITVRVTSYSNDSLDAGLFGIPAGYTQIPSDAERELGVSH